MERKTGLELGQKEMLELGEESLEQGDKKRKKDKYKRERKVIIFSISEINRRLFVRLVTIFATLIKNLI